MLVDLYLDDCKAYTNKVKEIVTELNEAISDRNPNRS